jgi:hypothetical protein
MESEEEKHPAVKKPDNRQHIQIPLAVPDFARAAYRAMKKEKGA